MGLGELYGHSFMEAWGKNIKIQGSGFSVRHRLFSGDFSLSGRNHRTIKCQCQELPGAGPDSPFFLDEDTAGHGL